MNTLRFTDLQPQVRPILAESLTGNLKGIFNIAGSTKSVEDLTVSGNASINAAGGKF